MEQNIILLTDSYKVTHHMQYPKGTQKIYSYFESRGGKFPVTVFFGLQYFIKKYLSGKVVTVEKIQEAKSFFKAHFGTENLFNEAGWRYILEKHKGRLPVAIKAVPEGSVVPFRNVLMSIENTDDKLYWLTNYLETILSQVWYPTTVATQSYHMKKIILRYLRETGDPALIDFKLHDFGFRGVSSVESAGIGDVAHLVNFKGTDTMVGLIFAREYYNENMAGFSIPASEHSTITSWGKENELNAFENMLNKYPTGTIACVSDSYNIYDACSNLWGEKLKDKILARDGTLVIRPDSGHPPTIVNKVLKILGDKFGYSINKKGYKVLNPKIRIIQGDGIYYEMLDQILGNMKYNGWSADNIAFGSGGALLQRLNRDTQKFAFKCSSATINGKEVGVFKQPITDVKKISKQGRLKLEHSEIFGWRTISNIIPSTIYDNAKDELVEVFRDGELVKEWSLEDIRVKANEL